MPFDSLLNDVQLSNRRDASEGFDLLHWQSRFLGFVLGVVDEAEMGSL